MAAIRRNEYYQLVILLQSRIFNRIFIVIVRQSHLVSKHIIATLRKRNHRTNNPVLTGSTVEVHVSVRATEDIRLIGTCTEVPCTGTSAEGHSAHNIAEQTLFLGPFALCAQTICIRNTDEGFERSGLVTTSVTAFAGTLNTNLIRGVGSKTRQRNRRVRGVLSQERPVIIRTALDLDVVGLTTTGDVECRAVRCDVCNVSRLRFVTNDDRTATRGNVQFDDITQMGQRTSYAWHIRADSPGVLVLVQRPFRICRSAKNPGIHT